MRGAGWQMTEVRGETTEDKGKKLRRLEGGKLRGCEVGKVRKKSS